MKKLNINTNGNKKLRNTENVRFMIWNLPAVKTCPYRTAMCEKSCYARKAERIYPQVLPSREQNYNDSLQADFVENMIYTIENELKRKVYNKKQVVFRIHESGDFYNVEYAEKWIRIAEYFKSNKKLVFLAYTKSITYFVNYGLEKLPHNFFVRSSLWDDTSKDKVNLTITHRMPMYTAFPRSYIEDAEKNGKDVQWCGERVFICRCDNCATCKLCWNHIAKNIAVAIH